MPVRIALRLLEMALALLTCAVGLGVFLAILERLENGQFKPFMIFAALAGGVILYAGARLLSFLRA